MTDCIFCKIIAGELPSDKVFEDKAVVAFLDVAPINSGHTLLVPKIHTTSMLDAPPETLTALVRVLPKIARAVSQAVLADGFNIGINDGAAAGQIVLHTHIHIIPRFIGDGFRHWGHRQYASGESARIAEDIQRALQASR